MTETSDNSRQDLLTELTVEIVCAHVGNNVVQVSDLPGLIAQVHSAPGSMSMAEPAPAEGPKPAVPVGKSVGRDFIICLEDGRKFKLPKRHLKTAFGLTPEQYREKWSLPADYPMVAPAHSERRARLAGKMGPGSGRKRRQRK